MKKIFFTLFITLFVIMCLSICVFAEASLVTSETFSLINRNSIAYFEGPGWNTGNGANADVIYGRYNFIHRTSMKTFLDAEGMLTSKNTGVKYDFSTVLKADYKETGAVITTGANSGYSVNFGDKEFNTLNFIATSRKEVNNSKVDIADYKVIVNYTDGTSEEKTLTIYGANTSNSLVVANPKLIYGYNTAVTTETYNMFEYVIPVNKSVKSLTFKNGQTPIILFAVSGANYLHVNIENKISSLPDTVTQDNISQIETLISEIDELLNEFVAAGGNVNSISNISKYNALKPLFPTVESINFNNDKQFLIVEAVFSSEISEETVNGYITLNDEKTEATEKTFSHDGGKTKVKLKFKHYRNYDKTHNFVIEKGAKDIASGLGMIKNFETEALLQAPFKVSDFKVIKTADSSLVESLEGFGSTEIKVGANLTNIAVSEGQSYIVVMGLYGNNNELIDCEIKTGSLAMGAEPKNESWTFTLPPDATENYNISYFVIDTEGKTLYNPISLK